MAKKSSLQDLMALYGSAPASTGSSDYYEAPKKKKKTAAPVKRVEGFKITDYDAMTRVQSAAKKDDSEDDEDNATMEVDRELEERLALERKAKRMREQSDGSGWVALDEKKDQGGDLSPPRKRPRHDDGDLSPPRRAAGGDLSPPRRGRPSESGDISPPRRGRPSESGDISPPRRGRSTDTGDISPPRRGRSTESGDISPPRRGRSTEAGDISPPRRGHPSQSRDISPPRRGATIKSESGDISPPRRRSASRDLSPPRRGATSGDISPPRRGRSSESRDLSPPRRGGGGDVSPPRRGASPGRVSSGSVSAKTRVSTGSMISGERAGLYSADEIVAENQEMLRRQMEEVKKMRPEEAGRDAVTVYRDRRGRPLAMLNQMMNQDKPGFRDETEDMEWGVGKVDKEAKKLQEEEDEAERNRGYHGITIHDERYNERMRERIRWDDPMAKYITPKKKETKKVYKGYCPPNRFNIRPGYRWDGVDRSNGFEARMFKLTNEAAAKAQKQLMWATADM